jgi:hypothetical protein
MQQAYAQTLFQRGNAAADPGGSQICHAAGSREAALFHHKGEEVEIVQVGALRLATARLVIIAHWETVFFIFVVYSRTGRKNNINRWQMPRQSAFKTSYREIHNENPAHRFQRIG